METTVTLFQWTELTIITIECIIVTKVAFSRLMDGFAHRLPTFSLSISEYPGQSFTVEGTLWIRYVNIIDFAMSTLTRNMWTSASDSGKTKIGVKVNWRFGGTCRLHLRDWRVSQTRSQLWAGNTKIILHSVIYQKIELFIKPPLWGFQIL
jgi:hypothetical protein